MRAHTHTHTHTRACAATQTSSQSIGFYLSQKPEAEKPRKTSKVTFSKETATKEKGKAGQGAASPAKKRPAKGEAEAPLDPVQLQDKGGVPHPDPRFPSVVELEAAFKDPSLLEPATKEAVVGQSAFVPIIDTFAQTPKGPKWDKPSKMSGKVRQAQVVAKAAARLKKLRHTKTGGDSSKDTKPRKGGAGKQAEEKKAGKPDVPLKPVKEGTGEAIGAATKPPETYVTDPDRLLPNVLRLTRGGTRAFRKKMTKERQTAEDEETKASFFKSDKRLSKMGKFLDQCKRSVQLERRQSLMKEKEKQKAAVARAKHRFASTAEGATLGKELKSDEDRRPSEGKDKDRKPSKLEHKDKRPSESVHKDRKHSEKQHEDKRPSKSEHKDRKHSEKQHKDGRPSEEEDKEKRPSHLTPEYKRPSDVQHKHRRTPSKELEDIGPLETDEEDIEPRRHDRRDSGALKADETDDGSQYHPDATVLEESRPPSVSSSESSESEVSIEEEERMDQEEIEQENAQIEGILKRAGVSSNEVGNFVCVCVGK